MFEMPAGYAAFAAGVERRQERRGIRLTRLQLKA
eukprot:UN08782